MPGGGLLVGKLAQVPPPGMMFRDAIPGGYAHVSVHNELQLALVE